MPWWLHFAKLGVSVGAGIATTAALIPFAGPYAPILGGIATVAAVVTHYAKAGVDASGPQTQGIKLPTQDQ